MLPAASLTVPTIVISVQIRKKKIAIMIVFCKPRFILVIYYIHMCSQQNSWTQTGSVPSLVAAVQCESEILDVFSLLLPKMGLWSGTGHILDRSCRACRIESRRDTWWRFTKKYVTSLQAGCSSDNFIQVSRKRATRPWWLICGRLGDISANTHTHTPNQCLNRQAFSFLFFLVPPHVLINVLLYFFSQLFSPLSHKARRCGFHTVAVTWNSCPQNNSLAPAASASGHMVSHVCNGARVATTGGGGTPW